MRASGDWPKVSPEVKAMADLAQEIWGQDE
jgi:hypothetical protein